MGAVHPRFEEDLNGEQMLFISAEIDPHRRVVTVLLRISDLASFLGGEESEHIALLRRRLKLLKSAGRRGDISISARAARRLERLPGCSCSSFPWHSDQETP